MIKVANIAPPGIQGEAFLRNDTFRRQIFLSKSHVERLHKVILSEKLSNLEVAGHAYLTPTPVHPGVVPKR